MTDSNRWQDDLNQSDLESSQGLANDRLDRELDAALAKYAAVEPRTGIEDRILANLRADQAHAAERSWWRWPAVAALAAVIVVTLSVAWRSGKPVQSTTAQHRPATTQTNEHAGTQVANHGGSNSIRPHEASGIQLRRRAVSNPATVVALAPKLDQFPSPQPLSEQERILARYVANYPEHAALIAQARTEELRRDRAEEMGEAAPPNDQDSQQQNK
jgi:hypothetical protein